jgi:hypothetical protein
LWIWRLGALFRKMSATASQRVNIQFSRQGGAATCKYMQEFSGKAELLNVRGSESDTAPRLCS